MWSRKIGIDIGSRTVRMWVKGHGVTLREPSVVLRTGVQQRVVALGHEALRGSTADGRQRARPVTDGGELDVNVMAAMLPVLIGRVPGVLRPFRPEVMMALPSTAPGAIRRRLTQAAIGAGAGQAWLIDLPLAAAIGAGLKIGEPYSGCVVEIGAARTEMAVIAGSGIMTSRTLDAGGAAFDAALEAMLEERHGLRLEGSVIHELKRVIGVLPETGRRVLTGTDAEGSPLRVEVDGDEVREALERPLGTIAQALAGLVGDGGQEVAGMVQRGGVMLTGGGALMPGMVRGLALRTGLRLRRADEPADAVVRGAGLALDRFEVVRRGQLYLR
ncbi:MAG TPA: rod shape-determining protein [Candidatus Dormibacteraeota bacterium]|nr:rod shape-determining protein [Candidatus Dormibacteraeota bacterium]